MKTFLMWLTVGLVGLAGCSANDGLTAPAERPVAPSLATGADDTPHFFHPRAGSPTFANPVVSFWAVKGQDRTASIWYHKLPGAKGRDSTEFVRFRVDRRSLLTRPDGTPIANGDSVLITMAVVDTLNLIVDFQPSGLQFDQTRPAVLTIKMGEADQDVNGDGVVDNADLAIFQSARIWGQESLFLPWFQLPTIVSLSSETYTANLSGFTRYAVSY